MQNHEINDSLAVPSVILLAAGRGSCMGSSTQQILFALAKVDHPASRVGHPFGRPRDTL